MQVGISGCRTTIVRSIRLIPGTGHESRTLSHWESNETPSYHRAHRCFEFLCITLNRISSIDGVERLPGTQGQEDDHVSFWVGVQYRCRAQAGSAPCVVMDIRNRQTGLVLVGPVKEFCSTPQPSIPLVPIVQHGGLPAWSSTRYPLGSLMQRHD